MNSFKKVYIKIIRIFSKPHSFHFSEYPENPEISPTKLINIPCYNDGMVNHFVFINSWVIQTGSDAFHVDLSCVQ